MEMNPLNINIDHTLELVWSNRDGGDGQGSGRLYTCTFCKRGFSNAQALGGHMNIHRKDRARLKDQSSEETLVLVDKCAKETSVVQQEEETSTQDDEKSSTLKRLWLFPEEDDDCASPRKKDAMGSEVVQLPLFVDEPSNVKERKISEADRVSDSSSPSMTELDLELRLGVDS